MNRTIHPYRRNHDAAGIPSLRRADPRSKRLHRPSGFGHDRRRGRARSGPPGQVARPGRGPTRADRRRGRRADRPRRGQRRTRPLVPLRPRDRPRQRLHPVQPDHRRALADHAVRRADPGQPLRLRDHRQHRHRHRPGVAGQEDPGQPRGDRRGETHGAPRRGRGRDLHLRDRPRRPRRAGPRRQGRRGRHGRRGRQPGDRRVAAHRRGRPGTETARRPRDVRQLRGRRMAAPSPPPRSAARPMPPSSPRRRPASPSSSPSCAPASPPSSSTSPG